MSSKRVELREVPFHGDVIMAGQDGEEILVDPKPVCEKLGIDWEKQRQKIANSAADGGWATTSKREVVAKDGRVREVVLITIETLLMWMATIKLGNVKGEYQDALRLYQREAGKALRKAFMPPTSNSPLLLEMIVEQMGQMSRAIAVIADRMVKLESAHAPHLGARETNIPLGIQERVREVWPAASDRQKARIRDRVKNICLRQGISCMPVIANGPLTVDQAHLPMVDREILRVKDEAVRFERCPLFDGVGVAN